MTEAQIRAALKKLGNPVGAEFSQRKGTSLAALKKAGQDMCKGLTLDWIRIDDSNATSASTT